MFISQLFLDRKLASLASDPELVHLKLQAAFGIELPAEEGADPFLPAVFGRAKTHDRRVGGHSYLHRCDVLPDGVVRIAVRSAVAPHFLAPGAFGRVRHLVAHHQSSEEVFPFAAGDKVRFLVRMNPAHKVAAAHDPSRDAGRELRGVCTRRRTVVADQAKSESLLRSRLGGLDVSRAVLVRRVRRTVRKGVDPRDLPHLPVEAVALAAGRPRTHFALACDDYEGDAVVADADRLAASWSEGVGPAKHLGCGMLLMVKV